MTPSTIYAKLAALIEADAHGYITKGDEERKQDRKRLTLLRAADAFAENIVALGQPLDTDQNENRISNAIDSLSEQINGGSTSRIIKDFAGRAATHLKTGSSVSVEDLFIEAITRDHEAAYFVGFFVGLHFAAVVHQLSAPPEKGWTR